MKREILFRGKTADYERWVYGYFGGGGVINVPIIDKSVGFESWDDVLVIPETVGQLYPYTDKMGSRIFEGDLIEVERKNDKIIVECKFGTIERQMATGFLVDITGFYFEREDGCQTFPIKKNYKGGHDLELFTVIGNIHDTPRTI